MGRERWRIDGEGRSALFISKVGVALGRKKGINVEKLFDAQATTGLDKGLVLGFAATSLSSRLCPCLGYDTGRERV